LLVLVLRFPVGADLLEVTDGLTYRAPSVVAWIVFLPRTVPRNLFSDTVLRLATS
jgi:hypothetical protein